MADKFQQLASECYVAVAFFGDPKSGKFDLLPVSSETVADFVRRENFLGMMGLTAGFRSRTALAVALDDATGSALAQSFLMLIERAIERIEESAGSNHKLSLP